MAEYALKSTVSDIANFMHDNRRPVGHLISLFIGGEELKPDFNFIDPLAANPKERIPLAGMLTSGVWSKKPGGVLLLGGNISGPNGAAFQDAKDSADKKATFKLKFKFHKFEDDVEGGEGGYFPCFHTDTVEVEGQLSDDYESYVEDDYDDQYKQIRNHKFFLALVGTDKKEQFLHIAYDSQRKKTYHFGQKRG